MIVSANNLLPDCRRREKSGVKSHLLERNHGKAKVSGSSPEDGSRIREKDSRTENVGDFS